MNTIIILFLVMLVGSWGATNMLLLGISSWWKVGDTSLTDEERKAHEQKAKRMVSFSFAIWTIMVYMIVQFTMGPMILGVMEAAGYPLPAAAG